MKIDYIVSEMNPYWKFVKNRIIALWGVGVVGKEFLFQIKFSEFVSSHKIKVECFDNGNNEFKTIESIKNKKDKYYVVVSFLREYAQAQKLLNEMGYCEIEDYLCLGKLLPIVNYPRISEEIYQGKRTQLPRNANKKLYILGNGPSLLNDIKKAGTSLFNNDCMCVNAMCAQKEYEEIRPKYYTIVDELFWHNKFDISAKRYASNESIFKCMIKKTKWDMYFFMPSESMKNEELISCIERNSYIHFTPVFESAVWSDIMDESYFTMMDEGIAAPYHMNVLVTCIFLGIRMNYEEIYLLGADHSWTKTLNCDDVGLYMLDKHFYDEDAKKEYLYSDTLEQRYMLSSEYFYERSFLYKAYEQLQRYAKWKRISIYNFTLESFIDIFPKIK